MSYAKHTISGEVFCMISALRKALLNSFGSAYHKLEEVHQRFESLQSSLSQRPQVFGIEASFFVGPFLDAINCCHTSDAAITAIALSAVIKFLQYDLIDHKLDSNRLLAEQIVAAIVELCNRTSQRNTDVEKMIRLKFCKITRLLLFSKIGCYLEDSSVFDLVKVLTETMLVAEDSIYRNLAEQLIDEIVQLVFGRLSTFTEESNGSNVARSDVLHRSSPQTDLENIREQTDVQSGSQNAKERSSDSLSDDLMTSDVDLVLLNEIRRECRPEGSSLASSSEDVSDDSLTNQAEDRGIPIPKPKDGEHNESVDLGGSLDSWCDVELSLKYGSSGRGFMDGDFLSPLGVFSRVYTNDNSTTYGVPLVNALLKTIGRFIDPFDQSDTERQILLGLNLLTTAIEVAGSRIINFPTVLGYIKIKIFNNILQLLDLKQTSTILASAMRLCYILFDSLRTNMKFHLESYLLKLQKLISLNWHKDTHEVKLLALESLISLMRIPGFIDEMYINYDCDIYCPNLLENFVIQLSENCEPQRSNETKSCPFFNALVCFIEMLNAADEIPSSKMLDQEAVRPVAVKGLLLTDGNSDQSSAFHTPKKKEQSNSSHRNSFTPEKNGHSRFSNVSSDLPENFRQDFVEMKRKKILTIQCIHEFNLEPAKGIQKLLETGVVSSPLNPEHVASFLKSHAGLNKTRIGEYISSRGNERVLEAFIESFDFSNLRIDEALRFFLEGFRLPGEAGLIGRVLHSLALFLHRNSQKSFASADAVYILLWAMIMLNVDLHNANVKKQVVPKTEEAFIKSLIGQNGRADFDRKLLRDIYKSIKTNEIVLPSEQDGLIKEKYLWKIFLERDAFANGKFIRCNGGFVAREIFVLSWPYISQCLEAFFNQDSTNTYPSAKLMLQFTRCVAVAARYSCSGVIDRTLETIYPLTGIQSATGKSTLMKYLAKNDCARIAARTMFSVIHRHADSLRNGWKQVIDCVLIFYKLGMLPANMTTCEDFVSANGVISIAKKIKGIPDKTDKGLLTGFVSTLCVETPEKMSRSESSEIDAKRCLLEFKPEFIYSESDSLQVSTLQALVENLILATSMKTENGDLKKNVWDEEATVFILELLVRVILKNQDRISTIWNAVQHHICGLISISADEGFQNLYERAVVGHLRIVIRLCKGEKVFPQLIDSLNVFFSLDFAFVRSTSEEITNALRDLMKTAATSIRSSCNWRTIFALLAVAGAGLKSNSSCLFAMLEIDLPNKTTERKFEPEVDYGALSMQTLSISPNSEILILQGCNFIFHDTHALTKSAQCLIDLIRDFPQSITESSIGGYVWCIRVFLEACLQAIGTEQKEVSKFESQIYRPRIAYSRIVCDLLGALRKIITDSNAKRTQLILDAPDLWSECWCPIMQAIARTSLETAEPLHSVGVQYLQQSLKIFGETQMRAEQWESCFERIIFPLLLSYARKETQNGLRAESFNRIICMMSAVFQQNLNSLVSLPVFDDLWLKIIEITHTFLNFENLNQEDYLTEKISQCLKNMITVMNTAGLFRENDSYTKLWSNTWSSLDKFLPHLKNEFMLNSFKLTNDEEYEKSVDSCSSMNNLYF